MVVKIDHRSIMDRTFRKISTSTSQYDMKWDSLMELLSLTEPLFFKPMWYNITISPPRVAILIIPTIVIYRQPNFQMEEWSQGAGQINNKKSYTYCNAESLLCGRKMPDQHPDYIYISTSPEDETHCELSDNENQSKQHHFKWMRKNF